LEETQVPYVLDPHLVRGLDYYTRTVFETFVERTPKPGGPPAEAGAMPPGEGKATAEEGAKRLAVVSGGRYDTLIELVGGKPTPAVGGAMGLERIIGIIREQGAKIPLPPKIKVFLVQLGELAKKKSFRIMEEFRRSGVSAAESLGRDSIRAQLKMADRIGAEYALIVGQKEALDDMIILREMSSGIQETIPQRKLIETLKRKFRPTPKQ